MEKLLAPVALTCSSELEQNSCRNHRLALSIVLQPPWALGREGLHGRGVGSWSVERICSRLQCPAWLCSVFRSP